MKKEWFTSAELAQAALPGIPSSRQGLELFIARSGVRSTAKARTKAGQGGGFEYHYSFLPAVAQAKLAFLNAEPTDPRPTKSPKSPPATPRRGKS